MVLEKIQTVEDYAQFYLKPPHNRPICRAGGNECEARLELIIISATEKYVFCPACRDLGLSSGLPLRLMDATE